MDTDYEAVVYDLDGTLVHLAVDWAVVATDVIEVYDEAGVDARGADLWGLMERADDHGIASEVEAAISEHEHAGAHDSRRLPLADELLDRSVPVGVCSLNCERACRIALDSHDLAAAIEAVVGRDSVDTHKPDPEPLLATVSQLGVEPSEAVFVGDSPRDGTTAERAGVDFRRV
ncbi:HAD family hydrolase [Halohasta salina]|uniref:HAD family hydrolase n=1 Tax=Halohasta salina TaxID=2961621 RepID=UPI0020A264F0|nr:HAD-IA family hydrolase [Halohasta salina]